MLSDILDAISLGQKLIRAITDLKKDIGAVRAGRSLKPPHSARMEALEGRIENLEGGTSNQEARIVEMEKSLKDTLLATEALAERMGKIFWIGIGAGLLSLVAITLSLLTLTHALR